MPLDRRITIGIKAAGAYDGMGEFVQGALTEYPAWAEVADKGAFRELETRGTEFDSLRRWKVRWFAALELARPDAVTITDETGGYTVLNIVRQDERSRRRQWIFIEGESRDMEA